MRKTLRSILLTVTIVAGICLIQACKGPKEAAAPFTFEAHPSPYNLSGAQFPRIEADSRVTFRFNAPNAKKVQVSIYNVPYDMVKDTSGVWTYTTSEPQDAGYHNYWMIVDSAIMLDPATDAFIGYSHMCNGFEIPDRDGGFYELKDVPHGNVLIKNYFSNITNGWRQVYIYTPPDYETNTAAKYPVLYLQHGGGEDQRVWIEMGLTNLILDNLIAEGRAKPFIVVMETSAAYKPGEVPPAMRQGAPGVARTRTPGAQPVPAAAAPAAQPGQAAPPRPRFSFNTYEEVMINELIPWVDSNFRTLSDQQYRAMAGLSMGSGVTRQITLANPDKFAYIGIFSGGSVAPADIPENSNFKLVFMSFGSRENGADGLKDAADALNKAGINSVSYVSPLTAHEWQSWRRSLYEFAMLLFKD